MSVSLSQARRKLLSRLRSRKGREREGLFLVEGIRSAREALAAGVPLHFAVLAPRVAKLAGGAELAERIRSAGVEVHDVEDDELAALSDTESPQGVILVCREPEGRLDDLGGAPAPGGGASAGGLRLLVLDGVQDPGNAGTLLRAAAAFALVGVVALDGTVDLFNPKVVRASAGAIFRLTLVHASWDEAGPWLRARGVRLLVADASGSDVASVSGAVPWALVVGSEGAGVRPAVASAGEPVAIPMPGGTESLNAAVAGSILLYMLTRERSVG